VRSRKSEGVIKDMEKIEFYDYNTADFLDNDEIIASYLNEVFKSGNVCELTRAINNVAKKYSMSKIAKNTGLNRSSLYKTLEKGKNPSFFTLYKVLNELNINITFNPVNKQLSRKKIKETV
jgi:probable addiction module antidote protein